LIKKVGVEVPEGLIESERTPTVFFLAMTTGHVIPHQRRSTEAPNGGVFKMWIARGPRTGLFLCLASRGLAEKPELETSPVRGTRLIARGVNPTIHCQSASSHHLLHQSETFFINSVLLINKYHCNKNGLKWPSSWSDTLFWPIILKENQQKGCQKSGKSTFTKCTFQTPGWSGIIKYILLSCVGMKRGSGWGVVVCNVETQCQNLNCMSLSKI